MCTSFFSQRMDNDLLDGLSGTVLAGGGVGASSTAHTVANSQFWPETATLPSLADGYLDNFGDVNPFVNFHDPLLHESFLGASDRMVRLARTSIDGGDGKLDGGSRSKADEGSVAENSRAQISSPRSLGTKKMLRKNQAVKKVVSIPAPAPASSKTTGEVVPSDLWAWRKYGQKPIKGSPYPRSYYRCSSSKGCSARKQVERSRADPTMLVITYTSEHNHPRPTQRNALAGSTRAQSAKNDSPASKDSRQNRGPPSNLKELQSKGSSTTPMVKEEDEEMETAIGIDDGDEFDLIFNQSFKHVMLELNHSDDFFTDLAELEAGPLMDLHLTKEFLGNKSDEERENKVLDPFSFFDWAGNSIGEAK